MTRLLITAAVILTIPAAAQTETQHAFDASFRAGARVDIVAHARLRIRPGPLGLYQVRGGPIVEYSSADRVKLIGGYYYAEQEDSGRNFTSGHRWFGGGEVALWKSRAPRTLFRGLAEWFEPAEGSAYWRYRFRVRISGQKKAAPYSSVENFWDARGWRSTRFAAGLRVNNGSRIALDFGYFVEPRRAAMGGTRHMFMTGVHWNFKTKRRGDPDM
jgi:hypothetical protein